MSETLLDEVSGFLRRFVVMTGDQAVAVTLWIAHTHAFDAADITPYLTVTSALKRSGKSRLTEVLKLLVREPLPTAAPAGSLSQSVERSSVIVIDEWPMYVDSALAFTPAAIISDAKCVS